MTTPEPATTRLMRSRDDAWLGGVCGGIAQRFGWDATLIRVLFVASVLLPGPQVLLYIVLWLVIPREPVAQLPATAAPISYPPSTL
ncbi:PspC domain-containing protein [Gordonia sp. SID5947]|uniref:PspC domain-containing protein n=1 Tax=Gordonia sp. SID5947 TaxID=2690315 RepID=UPI00136A9DA0|nr:PspC domain-containing protein [Gordonia sp. SID5947]MYR05026.1 PspC domain-containing protein [Gordonia sp. SID5947]